MDRFRGQPPPAIIPRLGTARAAKQLVDEHLGELPVVAVIYSHSHGDHWAGVRGVVDEADVRAGKVEIIALAGAAG